MRRKDFLNVLKNDIEGLAKYSKFDSYNELREKVPDAFDYFISLYAKAFPKGRLDGYEPKISILKEDLEYFNMELGLIEGYSFNLAYRDFFQIQEMKYWLSCKKEIEEIELIYGEYETIPEILEATGYTLSNLYSEMYDIIYNFKKDYREKLRQDELKNKQRERDAKANKVKNAKEETARKLAELKARREGKVVESITETVAAVNKESASPEIEVSELNLIKSSLNLSKSDEVSLNKSVDLSADGYCAFIKGIVSACVNVDKYSENVDNLTLKDIRMISNELKESNLDNVLKQVMDLMEKLSF